MAIFGTMHIRALKTASWCSTATVNDGFLSNVNSLVPSFQSLSFMARDVKRCYSSEIACVSASLPPRHSLELFLLRCDRNTRNKPKRYISPVIVIILSTMLNHLSVKFSLPRWRVILFGVNMFAKRPSGMTKWYTAGRKVWTCCSFL